MRHPTHMQALVACSMVILLAAGAAGSVQQRPDIAAAAFPTAAAAAAAAAAPTANTMMTPSRVGTPGLPGKPAVLPPKTIAPAVLPPKTIAPAVLPAKPTTLPAKPAVLPTKPTTLPAKPAILPTKPTTLPAKPAILPTKPTTLPAKPAILPVKPIVLPAVLPVAKPPVLPPVLPTGTIVRTFGRVDPRKTTIKLGCIAPFTGVKAASGEAMFQALRLAIQEQAARELGTAANVVLTCVDTKCADIAAYNGMDYLVKTGSVAVFGEVCSAATIAAAGVANSLRTPLISAASSSPALSTAGDYFFRTVPSDRYQAVAAADMVLAARGRRCVVLAENSAYGFGLSFSFIASYTAKGGSMVGKYEFNRGAGNTTAALDLVRRGRADCVFMAMNDLTFAADFLRAAGAARLQAKLFGGDSVMDPAMFRLLGTNGAALTAGLRGINFGLGTPAFLRRYTGLSGNQTPNPIAAHAYDAATAWMKAYRAAAAPKRGSQIIGPLGRVAFDGATGRVAFDRLGDRVAVKDSYAVFKFGQRGALVLA